MRRLLMAVLAVSLLIAVGCGGTSSTTGSTASTKSTRGASVQQYASLISQSDMSVAPAARATLQCSPQGDEIFHCSQAVVTAATAARSITDALTSAGSEGSSTYLGPPPQEIQALVQQTQSDARKLLSAIGDYSRGGCVKTFATACQEAYQQVTLLAGMLNKDIDGWSPYGVTS